jgi:hypothetical protein
MPFIPGAVQLEQAETIQVALASWTRLEALPLAADISGNLAAPVADPLWLLARQWQSGELHGEDAGTPVSVQLAGETSRLARFLPGPIGDDAATRALDYQTEPLPLEVAVEREQTRRAHPRLAADAGLHFLRLLTQNGVAALRDGYTQAYPLTVPEPADPFVDPRGAALADLVNGRLPDGAKLAADFRKHRNAQGKVTSLSAKPAVTAAQKPKVLAAATAFLAWFDGALTEPAGPDPAWNPHRLEYALAASATTSAGPVLLEADEYTGARLDWWSFRATADGTTLGAPKKAVPAQPLARHVLPAPASYPGMPADRWWEFEDAATNLGALDAGPTDLGRLLLVEFALVYGNDWFVVPIDLPVGALFRVLDCHVRDTFGVVTAVGPSRNTDGSRWSMFELTAPDDPAYLRDLFFLAPTLPRTIDGDPLEEVALFRDEMANMVWAVERRVQGGTGEAVDRYLEASRAAVHQRVLGDIGDAQIVYRLATPVPENWIPFIPVPAAGHPAGDAAIELERRAMLRTLATGATELVLPKGLVLRAKPDEDVEHDPPLRLAEEEVPRTGIAVSRAYSYSRWLNGAGYLWLGRAKRTGRGEGSSGLRYDAADPPTI